MIESWIELRRDAQGYVVDERWVETGHKGTSTVPHVILSPAERARRQFTKQPKRV